MAKNQGFTPKPSTPAPAPSAVKSSTPARNTPIPKAEAGRRDISHEAIAKRAYEIFRSGKGGTQDENWHRAERELRGL